MREWEASAGRVLLKIADDEGVVQWQTFSASRLMALAQRGIRPRSGPESVIAAAERHGISRAAMRRAAQALGWPADGWDE